MASHVSSCMRCLFRRDLHVKKSKEASASTVVTRVTTLLEGEFEFSRSFAQNAFTTHCYTGREGT